MKDWMGALASQYRRFRARYPEEQLAIVFDIDGTILDMRFQICHVLFAYDRAHGTKHFYGVSEDDIIVHENQVDRFLATRPLTAEQRAEIRAWYEAHLWSSEAMLAAHEPFRGVLDVIRWFQIQPRTVVALNTGRAESLREDTLRSLNALGDEYSIQFDSELLYMNPLETEENTPHYKSEGLDHFAKMGYRVFAVVDNEPDNIAHMAAGRSATRRSSSCTPTPSSSRPCRRRHGRSAVGPMTSGPSSGIPKICRPAFSSSGTAWPSRPPSRSSCARPCTGARAGFASTRTVSPCSAAFPSESSPGGPTRSRCPSRRGSRGCARPARASKWISRATRPW